MTRERCRKHVGGIDLVAAGGFATPLIHSCRVQRCRIGAAQFGKVVLDGGLVGDDVDQRLEHANDPRRGRSVEDREQGIEPSLVRSALQQVRVHAITPFRRTSLPVGLELGVAEPVEDLLDRCPGHRTTAGIEIDPLVNDTDMRITTRMGSFMSSVSTIGIGERLPTLDHDREVVERQSLRMTNQ